MANTVDSDLYGVAVATGALRALQSDVKPFSAFSTNFSADAGQRNGTVIVPLTSAGSTSSNFSGSYGKGDTTISERTVAMTGHKFQSWHITDVQAAKSSWLSIENIGVEKTQKLLIDVLQDVWGVVTNANYGAAAFTGAASTFDHYDVIDIQTACDAANWGSMNRSMILTPSYYNALFKDDVTGADVYGSALVARGELPQLAGFTMHKSNSVPANGENLVGFACLPESIAIANRYLAPVNGGSPSSIYRAITEPQTGLTLGYRQYYDDDAGAVVAVLECFYGFQIGVASSIKRLVSA